MILSILGIVFTLVTFILSLNLKNKNIPRFLFVFLTVIFVFLSINYYDIRFNKKIEYVSVYDLTGLPYENALSIVRQQGLDLPREIPSGSDTRSRILTQSPKADEHVLTGEVINVTLESNLVKEEPIVPHQPYVDNPDDKVIFSSDDVYSSNTDLTLDKVDLNYFHDGYYYEYQIPNEEFISFVDFEGEGFYGDLYWNRSLTDLEQQNVAYSCLLFDDKNNEIESNSTDSIGYFFSNNESSARFVCKYPKWLPEGTYTYQLTVYINKIPYTYRIPVTHTQ